MIIEGKKVNRKWMENRMIIWLFGIKESEKKMRGKKEMY
jgi:hypothetical protein